MTQTLEQSLNEISDEYPFHVGWYFKDLASGEAADRNGYTVVPSASTRKISILMAALKDVHDGKLRLEEKLTLGDMYMDNSSGAFRYFLPGFTVSLRDVLTMMIIVSDNVCTGTVVDLVGTDRLNDFCSSIGMRGTTHRHPVPPAGVGRDHPVDAVNTTTPADVGLLLDLILQGTEDTDVAAKLGSSPELCRLGLDILSWQLLRTKLPSMLPEGTKVAHKTGTGVREAGLGSRNHNDAGIVFQGDRPLFILSAYTEHVPGELPDGTPGHTACIHLIGRLARACWDALAD